MRAYNTDYNTFYKLHDTPFPPSHVAEAEARPILDSGTTGHCFISQRQTRGLEVSGSCGPQIDDWAVRALAAHGLSRFGSSAPTTQIHLPVDCSDGEVIRMILLVRAHFAHLGLKRSSRRNGRQTPRHGRNPLQMM